MSGCRPEESVGLLVAVEPERYKTLRLLFPRLWDDRGSITNDTRRDYADYRTILPGAFTDIDEANAVRHAHAQINFSFGMRADPDDPQLLRGLAWAAMVSGAAVYCGKVQELRERRLELVHQDESFPFITAVLEAEQHLGIYSVAYLPIEVSIGRRRLFLGFYSPIPYLFGHLDAGKHFQVEPQFLQEAKKRWAADLLGAPFLRALYEALLSYDALQNEAFGLIGTKITGRALEARQFYATEIQKFISGPTPRTVGQDGARFLAAAKESLQGVHDRILHDEHFAMLENLQRLLPQGRSVSHEGFSLSQGEFQATCNELLRYAGSVLDMTGESRTLGGRDFELLSCTPKFTAESAQPNSELVAIGRAFLRNAKRAVEEYLDSVSSDVWELDPPPTDTLANFECGLYKNANVVERGILEVSNWVPYDGYALNNFWAVRQGLIRHFMTPGQTGSGGLGLFLVRQLAIVRGYNIDVTLKIPELSERWTQWFARVYCTVR
jgi:hypothetical protein